MWWTRVERVPVRHRMSSVYLCPILLILALVGIDTLAPLVPALILVGLMTGILFHRGGNSTLTRTVLSVLGHVLVAVPYLRRGAPSSTPTLPSVGVIALVLALYYSLDMWPYCIPPWEFALVTLSVVCLVS